MVGVLSARGVRACTAVAGICIALTSAPDARADEGGVSLWLPGTFGSLSAVPGTPGWAMTMLYYHTSVEAGGDVAAQRTRMIAGRNVTANLNLNLELDARADLVALAPTYTFETPVWGGRLSVMLMGIYGRQTATVNATLTGALGPFGFGTARSISDELTAFGDLYPRATLSWNQGVHNYMIYGFSNIPVGSYEAGRLANIGIGHWAIDGGAGYTYFDPTKGHEFSVVAGLTYNFENTHTDYQNGIDLHVDWAASQFLSKQLFVGVVGYAYKQLTADSGQLAIFGDAKSQVFGIGPQVGFLFPANGMQGVLNIKGYYEFEAEHRPEGWNVWVGLAFSPMAKQAAAPAPKPAVWK